MFTQVYFEATMSYTTYCSGELARYAKFSTDFNHFSVNLLDLIFKRQKVHFGKVDLFQKAKLVHFRYHKIIDYPELMKF